MDDSDSMRPIPREVAWELCAEIRDENRDKLYTFAGMWCWGCRTFTKGNLNAMCVSRRSDFRGCAQVNARFEQWTHAHVHARA
ncbi:hypothetical protein ANRL1_03799 [Anaerolineae bacterium]|nr:hypothetical protein ANRL1_03799 [Anaerolineae bacterium]